MTSDFINIYIYFFKDDWTILWKKQQEHLAINIIFFTKQINLSVIPCVCVFVCVCF